MVSFDHRQGMPHQIKKHSVPESLYVRDAGHFCMVASGPEVTTVQLGGMEHSLRARWPGFHSGSTTDSLGDLG